MKPLQQGKGPLGTTELHQEAAEAAGFESWAEWVATEEAAKGYEICGAFATSRRAPCTQRRPDGRASGRCHTHHRNGRGPAANAWKGAGRGWLAEIDETDYGLLLESLSLAHEQATMALLFRAHRDEVRAGRGSLETAAEAVAELREAVNGDEGAARALEVLEASLAGAVAAEDALDRMIELAEARRKLVETESRQQERAREMVPRNVVLAWGIRLRDGVVEDIESVISDAEERRELRRRIVGRLELAPRREVAVE